LVPHLCPIREWLVAVVPKVGCLPFHLDAECPLQEWEDLLLEDHLDRCPLACKEEECLQVWEDLDKCLLACKDAEDRHPAWADLGKCLLVCKEEECRQVWEDLVCPLVWDRLQAWEEECLLVWDHLAWEEECPLVWDHLLEVVESPLVHLVVVLRNSRICTREIKDYKNLRDNLLEYMCIGAFTFGN